ncbi:hypothetical protein IEQ34_007867 [Dendrobium chrysotoxum]|uniref:Fe2OG dioxygenase domain-containing protein n=1 Tax=Dendrobium chrysotoxum TaxID=161865 RepID=A0AAV7H509_DENCH|nr:hypothetical protein IEQ34_007867 [Dendrobium chrysotoxum]
MSIHANVLLTGYNKHPKVGSLEIYDHISWVDLSKNQKIIKKRKMNTQEFVEEEKFDSNPKNTKLSIEERKQRCFLILWNKKKLCNFSMICKTDEGIMNLENGIPPGILCNGIVDPILNLFKIMINRLITLHVLPISCVHDSCIINIYESDDCIPPHIDNYDFVRPFCTISFLSKYNIIFGHNIKIIGPDEFIGSASILLSVGYVLVLNSNGTDLAKHCIHAVSYKMISVTFKKMDKTKRPHNFKFDSDFQNIISSDFSDASES